MSAMAPVPGVAPITLRLRLAVSALLVSWALAALFIVLGWREARTEATSGSPTVMQSSVPSHAQSRTTVPAASAHANF